MVNTINELSELSRKLNQKSDKTNEIIAGINEKLAGLNLGIEVWLDRQFDKWLRDGDFERVGGAEQRDVYPREKEVAYLGYCNVETGWQLAIKEATLLEHRGDDGEVIEEDTDVSYRPLLRASRETRIAALPLVPRLLDVLKAKAESVLRSIDEAEKAAEKL